MFVVVKSIAGLQDESITCFQTGGSLTTKKKTRHGSTNPDECLRLQGAGNMLYDTNTVTASPGLDVVYFVDAGRLTDLHSNGCCWFSPSFYSFRGRLYIYPS